MTAKIGYSVIFTSSNENGHEGKELEIRNNIDSNNNKNSSENKGKGWQSSRFCDYPQDLIIRLDDICEISQIQILSHQSKIASKIEIWIGLEHNTSAQHNYLTYKSLNWKRLGYLSLDKNERSNWKARELKSVYINSIANYIKFSFYESHINTINLFNQIGIVGLTILGKKTSAINNEATIATNINETIGNNNNNNNNFDKITNNKINELEILKKQAVLNEDYDEAKRCKICIENLRNSAKELFILENEKKIAVEKEDYDCAKSLKLQIEKLRSMSLNINQNNNKPQIQQAIIQPQIQPQIQVIPTAIKQHSISPNMSINMNSLNNMNNNSIISNAEERQIRPMKRNYNTIDVNNVNDPFGDSILINNKPMEMEMEMQPATNGERPPLLKASIKKTNEKLIEIFGEYIICLLNSPNWNHRDEGLKKIIEFLNEKDFVNIQNGKLIFKLCCKIIYASLNDRVAGVILSAIDLLNVLINVSDGQGEDKNLYSCIVILVNILGNNNNRLIDGSGSILISLCHNNDGLCKIIYNLLIKKMKKILPKHLKGRGLILLQLIPKFNLPKGIDLNILLNNLILPQLINKNGEIRDIGIKIICLIYKINDLYKNKIIYYLENNHEINDFLKETLNKSIKQCCGHMNVLQRAPKSIKEQSRPSRTMNKTNDKNEKKIHKTKENNNNINIINEEEEEEEEEEMPDDVCNFCGLKDQLFIENEENLDLHYWQSCPMLTSCKLCEQVIEIATLHEHILTECESGIKHEICHKCNIPYNNNENNNNEIHKCPNNIHANKPLCPLCLNNIQSISGNPWKIHLLKYPGCKSNPRPLLQ